MKSDTYKFLGVDFGSTSIKTALFSVSEHGELKEEKEAEWIDYTPDREYTEDGLPFHLLKPAHLDELLHILHERIVSVTQTNNTTPNVPILVVSGLTNTLALSFKGKAALLLDDPSLIPLLSREEEIIISRTCGVGGLRGASSLMKLLAIKKNPDICLRIFGIKTPVKWNEITFSTALAVITGSVTKTKERYSVPYDDLRAFGLHTLTAPQTIALLDALDVLPQKFTVSPSRIVHTSTGQVFQINDFQAEASLISRLFELGLIPQTAIVISLDTVGKFMTKYLKFSKIIADISYDTLRNSGRVVKTWIKGLLDPITHHALYEEMERILTTTRPDDGGYLFYPASQQNQEGVLIAPDGTCVTFDAVHTIPRAKRQRAVVAVVRGVGYEMRHMIEKGLNDNSIKGEVPIVLYGGLTGHNQHGWIQTLAGTLPKTDNLFTLPLKSGSLAAVSSAISELPGMPSASLSFTLTKIRHKNSGAKIYAAWVKKRPV